MPAVTPRLLLSAALADGWMLNAECCFSPWIRPPSAGFCLQTRTPRLRRRNFSKKRLQHPLYFVCNLLSANLRAVASASAAFTLTSGSTPVPFQSLRPKGLMDLTSVIVNTMEDACVCRSGCCLPDDRGALQHFQVVSKLLRG